MHQIQQTQSSDRNISEPKNVAALLPLTRCLLTNSEQFDEVCTAQLVGITSSEVECSNLVALPLSVDAAFLYV